MPADLPVSIRTVSSMADSNKVQSPVCASSCLGMACQWCTIPDSVSQLSKSFAEFQTQFSHFQEQSSIRESSLVKNIEDLKQDNSMREAHTEVLDSRHAALSSEIVSLSTLVASLGQRAEASESSCSDLRREITANRKQVVVQLEESSAEVSRRSKRLQAEISESVEALKKDFSKLQGEVSACREEVVRLRSAFKESDPAAQIESWKEKFEQSLSENLRSVQVKTESTLAAFQAWVSQEVQSKLEQFGKERSDQSSRLKASLEAAILSTEQKLETTEQKLDRLWEDASSTRRAAADEFARELNSALTQMQEAVTRSTAEARADLDQELSDWRSNLSTLQDACLRGLRESQIQVTCSTNVPTHAIDALSDASKLIREGLHQALPYRIRKTDFPAKRHVTPSFVPEVRRSSSVPTFHTPPRQRIRPLNPYWT